MALLEGFDFGFEFLQLKVRTLTDGALSRPSRDALLAVRDVLIDSCCIDKTSSTELSEAINSMFNWYALSEVCYVYLEDVPHAPPP